MPPGGTTRTRNRGAGAPTIMERPPALRFVFVFGLVARWSVGAASVRCPAAGCLSAVLDDEVWQRPGHSAELQGPAHGVLRRDQHQLIPLGEPASRRDERAQPHAVQEDQPREIEPYVSPLLVFRRERVCKIVGGAGIELPNERQRAGAGALHDLE